MKFLKYGSTGPDVDLLQSTLNKLGYYNGKIDGIFGNLTLSSVKNFQKNFGLTPDGKVEAKTWDALFPYINGFNFYEIKPGDTLYSIAKRYNTSVDSILSATPILDPYNLQVGQIIIVPFGSIVPTNVRYSYDIMNINLSAFKYVYRFLEIGSIGKSVAGRDIPYVKIGRGNKTVFYNASIHANEWITSVLLMKFIEDYAKAAVLDEEIYGYKARDLYEYATIYIVPMANPDGVNLVTGATEPGNEEYEATKKIASSYPKILFPSGWKANLKGVDLNLQFPAGWEDAKKIKYEQGFTSPAPRDFVGYAPLTEPEALALYNFTLGHNFSLTLSYHTQGKVIYWSYLDFVPPGSIYIGEQFAKSSGYLLEKTPYESSFAGYKDWFIQNYNKPGYTIEAGIGVNPLPISQFNEIYKDNEGILVLGAVLPPE